MSFSATQKAKRYEDVSADFPCVGYRSVFISTSYPVSSVYFPPLGVFCLTVLNLLSASKARLGMMNKLAKTHIMRAIGRLRRRSLTGSGRKPQIKLLLFCVFFMLFLPLLQAPDAHASQRSHAQHSHHSEQHLKGRRRDFDFSSTKVNLNRLIGEM